jgi:uncharacterized membrane protein
MLWIFLALAGYFLNAIVELVDKFLLSSKIKDPLTYSFYAGLLSSLVFVLWPFDFSFISYQTAIFAIFSGMTFFLAIYFLYKAMFEGEASRVISVIGGVSPVIVFSLSYFFLKERLPAFWLVAFLLLISGSVLLTLERDKKNKSVVVNKKFPAYSLAAAIFFSFTFFSSKAVFLRTSFLNGFIWIRLGTFASVVFVFLTPFLRKDILKNASNVSKRVSFGFVSNKILSAASFFVLSYAIKLGSVAVINALQGVQYVFLFALALAVSFYRPEFLSETISWRGIVQKAIAVILISVGVVLLFLV